MALVASPAAALAAEEESGGASTPAETVTEAPTGAAEPAASSPGWTPVSPDAGAPSDGTAPIRRGSSLGSGAGHTNSNNDSSSSEQVESTGEEPSYTAGSGGYDEPESSTPSPFEETASTGQAENTARPVAPPAPIAKAANVDLGIATPLTLPVSPRGGNEGSAPPTAPAAPLMNSSEQVGSDSNALLLLAVIVLGLSLAYAGWRVGLDLWQRRAQRQHLEVRRSREADWEAFLHRIERAHALGASDPSEQLHRAELGSEAAPLKVRTNGSASQDPARGTPVKTG